MLTNLLKWKIILDKNTAKYLTQGCYYFWLCKGEPLYNLAFVIPSTLDHIQVQMWYLVLKLFLKPNSRKIRELTVLIASTYKIILFCLNHYCYSLLIILRLLLLHNSWTKKSCIKTKEMECEGIMKTRITKSCFKAVRLP